MDSLLLTVVATRLSILTVSAYLIWAVLNCLLILLMKDKPAGFMSKGEAWFCVILSPLLILVVAYHQTMDFVNCLIDQYKRKE